MKDAKTTASQSVVCRLSVASYQLPATSYQVIGPEPFLKNFLCFVFETVFVKCEMRCHFAFCGLWFVDTKPGRGTGGPGGRGGGGAFCGNNADDVSFSSHCFVFSRFRVFISDGSSKTPRGRQKKNRRAPRTFAKSQTHPPTIQLFFLTFFSTF
jgi:hypothetical protein